MLQNQIKGNEMYDKSKMRIMFCPYIHPRPWGQNCFFFLKVVMLHIKLKGIMCTITCKQIFCPYTVGQTVKNKHFHSEYGYVASEIKGNEMYKNMQPILPSRHKTPK